MSKGQAERKAAHFLNAIESFRQAAEIARKGQSPWQEASALKSLSASEVRVFQYREALQSAETARLLALQTGDDTLAGAALNNEASVYQELGDYLSAEKAAQEAVILLQYCPRKDYFATALLNYGTVESELRNMRDSVNAFQQAVSVAQKASLLEIEASAQDHLGPALTDLKDFAGAERALKEAQHLRRKQHDTDGLAVTYANLAYLAYNKGEFATALPLLRRALVSHSHAFSTVSPYWSFHLEGQILQGLGRQSEALSAFEKAVTLAGDWRQDALPGDATSTRTVVALHEVYQDYIELAAELSLKRHDPTLAKQAYTILIQSRASSLREQMLSALGQQMRLPPRYFELLSNLQTMQAAVTLGQSKTENADKAKLDQIRAELTDLENKIGLHQENLSISTEKLLHRNSLRDIQRSLSGNALLLSFCLGKDRSFLWAVTRDDMNLYELPAEDTLAAHARAFSQAVQRSSSSAQGTLLTSELFGKLSPRASAKPDWLIAADGALLDGVPFSALPQSSRPEATLAAAHALRFVPSELLLADAKAPEPQRRFVGIADPIYNLADSRRARPFSFFPVLHAEASSVTLARLVGSEREVRSAAKLSQVPEVTILSGAQASVESLRAALANSPEVLHFAVHVVSPQNENGPGDEAALALSLTSDNMPELLTKEAIATLRVPGSLVVLSGCSSQQGENLPSAGLIGLSRAWLLAGASAVIVSAWPTPDDSGRFFTAFYKHLQPQSAPSGNIAQRAATALQQTQLDMQHSTGYRSSPSFWAAYSLISKE
ncbi:MAG: CHAT domain-containing tetratricopeptide repeat protein [Acidobacteriota bacterium]|nr:CHAT domain-containing tetratricopeptide repeat protein [Acidobacteriota bacterium]